MLTSRRSVMGAFVNHRGTTVAAIVVATVISALNVFLLGQTFFG
jgi:manganese transport protein